MDLRFVRGDAGSPFILADICGKADSRATGRSQGILWFGGARAPPSPIACPSPFRSMSNTANQESQPA
eukprot:scaffold46438_cov29-Tisochrysis_lutea.AAC.7